MQTGQMKIVSCFVISILIACCNRNTSKKNEHFIFSSLLPVIKQLGKSLFRQDIKEYLTQTT
jgi:hypothetical protein